ncbi:type II and III secretion system protein [Terriglobus albidus]|uniref:type II and III secretion system protein n=1 Tax=Terriglobus albidus TaxID=1592106 RepID=UPI0021DF72A6|nr:type II and III secretion system protein [Terriglobus albidus]
MKHLRITVAAVLFAGAAWSYVGAQTPTKPVSAKQARKAADAYLEGARALDRNDLVAAEKAFARAFKLDPSKAEYAAAALTAREHRVTGLVQQSANAGLSGNLTDASRLLEQARALAPDNPIVTQHFANLDTTPRVEAVPTLPADATPQLAGPISLVLKNTPISLHLRGGAREAYVAAANQAGLHVTFGNGLSGEQTKIDLDGLTYQRCLDILGQLFHTFAVPIDEHTIVVANDTLENHDQYEHLFQETVYLAGLNNNQMTELGNVVRQVFDIKLATVQVNSGNLVVRAPEQSIKAMNAVLSDLLDGGSEVVFDLKVYALDTSRTRNVGIILPTQLSAYNLASQAQSIISANQSLINQLYAAGIFTSSTTPTQIALYLLASGVVSSSLLSNSFLAVGGGLTTTVLSAGLTPILNLGFTSSDSRALDDVMLRVRDREQSTFRAGTRYPIATSLYSDLTSSSRTSSLLSQYLGTNSSSNLLSSAIPQIQYEDLGLTFKAEPTIQKTGDIHVKMDFKIEALAGSSLNGIPVLASRQYASDVTTQDGDTIMLVSAMSEQEAYAVSGLPGLSELPGFGSTTNKQSSRSKSDLVILLTPHIVRSRRKGNAGPLVPITVSNN